MKKLFILILLFTAFMSCDKEPDDLTFSEAVPGGCALEKGASSKGTMTLDVNKVSYSIVNGSLDIFVGFNATCCGEYSTTAEIKGDTITIKIITTQEGLCNCICYYTYNFKFIGSGKNYNYLVTVDDYLTFTGEIKP